MSFSQCSFEERHALLARAENIIIFPSALRGVEREGLRVNAEGQIAQTPHPTGLGSALTHPNITTDYSEALLEFITEPSISVEEALQQLRDLIGMTLREMPDECLWSSSMPCQLGDDANIPVANYGTSNIGQMKRVYRLGLGHRYGRKMQTIAGVHFNYSPPDAIWNLLRRQDRSHLPLQDYKTEGYFALIRNFRRWIWLLLYLTGASPAVCRSFVKGRSHQLVPFGEDEHSLHAPYATSLRMGDLGYQSSAQGKLVVCFNSLDRYIEVLRSAILTDEPGYRNLGIRDEAGAYKQLNAGLLQIENEFYSTVRPKQTARRGETQLKALADRGVEYVEVRCLDLDPFEPLGIGEQRIRFTEAFLLACLMHPSPMTYTEEYRAIAENQRLTVYQGREPGLKLGLGDGSQVTLSEWARQIFTYIERAASLLDCANLTDKYSAAVAHYATMIDHPELTPSARVLQEMAEQKQTYFRWSMEKSRAASDAMRRTEIAAESQQFFAESAEQSRRDQARMESADSLDFSDYLSNYYNQYREL